MITGPLITAASRLGSSVVTDGDSAAAPSWQPRSAAAATPSTDDALWPPRTVSPRQCRTWACNCHWPWGLVTLARPAIAELRVSCGKAGVAHTSSNRNRGVAVPVIGTATAAGEGQRYVEFSGIPDDEIHAVSGIRSHTGGQVSGSAWAATNDTHPTA